MECTILLILGWYDFVLAYSIAFSFVVGSLKLELKESLRRTRNIFYCFSQLD